MSYHFRSKIFWALKLLFIASIPEVCSQGSWKTSPQNSSVLSGGSIMLRCQIGNNNGAKTNWFRNGRKTQVSENYWTIDPQLYAVVGEDDGEFNLQIKNASMVDNTTFTCRNIAVSPHSKTAYIHVINGNPAAIRMAWYINGVNMSSAEPWSIATADGKFSSSSLCEVDHSRYSGNVSLTCEVIQSGQVNSITETVFLNVPAGANGTGASLILMTVTMVITLVLTQSFRLL